MKIKLFYDDEYIEGKSDYSYIILTIESWRGFWDLWNIQWCDFIRGDNTKDGRRVYLRKDRVVQIIGEDDEI